MSKTSAWLAGRPMALLPDTFEILAAGILPLRENDATKMFSQAQSVAIISIQDVLHNGSYWGGTSYAEIRAGLVDAVSDPKIKAVALHIDSPGGEVAGNFDLSDLVAEAKNYKPIWGILNESAYSAAYSLASACSYITVPRTGGVGSIGVITQHADISKMLEQRGVKVTSIHYGARKADGSPFKPMEAAAKSRMQADIDAIGEMFVDLVARNRKIDPQRVRDTEAGTFRGSAGVEMGLADAVMSPDAAFLALVNSLK